MSEPGFAPRSGGLQGLCFFPASPRTHSPQDTLLGEHSLPLPTPWESEECGAGLCQVAEELLSLESLSTPGLPRGGRAELPQGDVGGDVGSLSQGQRVTPSSTEWGIPLDFTGLWEAPVVFLRFRSSREDNSRIKSAAGTCVAPWVEGSAPALPSPSHQETRGTATGQ